MSLRLSIACAVVLAAVTVVVLRPHESSATSLPLRTYIGSVSTSGGPADGTSQNAALSTTGRVLAFDTTATNVVEGDANGPVRDVVAIDLATNERRLVSDPGGDGANGASWGPILSANGQRVAFTSQATNLVPGDTNGFDDVFVRTGRDPIQLVSVGMNDQPANGPSSSPDISADGNEVVFVSAASNLVPDDTNNQADVFVRDLATGRTTRVSLGDRGDEANARSFNPAISADGNFVAFTSGASNLVSRDTNGITDVFVRDLRRATTDRVSVNSDGKQQNRSVSPPFTQITDISRNGRYVVFDSDATNLYSLDTNKHTDVFLRDRHKQATSLVSASSTNVQGNNDSFAPKLSPSGRYLSFESFASNLAPGGGPREDIFIRDLRQKTTSVVNVTATGGRRGSEQVPELLQRPALSNDGRFAAFSSTVTNLAPDDTNGYEDVFLRLLDPPVARVVKRPKVDHAGTVEVETDDPVAFAMTCQIDNGPLADCGRVIPIRRKLGHILKIRPGGPGMLYSSDVLKVRLSRDYTPPRVTVTHPGRGPLRVIRGHARDRSGIALVTVGFVYSGAKGCRALATRKRFVKVSRKACVTTIPVRATGARNWRLRLPHAIHGTYAIYAHAVDKVGNSSKIVPLIGSTG